MAEPDDEDVKWWPERKDWPEFPPVKEWEDRDSSSLRGFRLGADQALALLLLEDIVVTLNGGEKGIVLQVICSDVFYWGTADSQRIPPLGFGADGDKPFWDLYDSVRKNGEWGAVHWCCLQRKMRPQPPVERSMRDMGAWDDEMEALPVRDPKECG